MEFKGNTYNGDSIELRAGLFATVYIDHDKCYGKPWEEEDGHGIIEERRTNYTGYIPTAPGERVIFKDRNYGYVYDEKGTLERARSEGWGLSEKDRQGLTQRQITAEAVRRDMESMRAWLNDEWHYCTVTVRITDSEGMEIANASLGGVSDECPDYLTGAANEVLSEALAQLPDALESTITKMVAHTESLKAIREAGI